MDKLELKHLAPYLPYGLEIKTDQQIRKLVYNWTELEHSINTDVSLNTVLLRQYKPILRPLSDLLDKDLDYWIDFSESIEDLQTDYLREAIVNGTAYSIDIRRFRKINETLFEMHFDVFGLIDKGLAIDVNTIKE